MKKIFLVAITLLFLFACKHELEKPKWDVDLLVPLVHSEMSINDMLSDSALTLNEDEEGGDEESLNIEEPPAPEE